MHSGKACGWGLIVYPPFSKLGPECIHFFLFFSLLFEFGCYIKI